MPKFCARASSSRQAASTHGMVSPLKPIAAVTPSMSNTLESAPGSKESIPSELTGSSSSLKLSDSLVSITGLEEVSLQSTKAIDTDCPDGGTHAWLEAFGATGIFFCTVGYINSFG